MALFDDSFLTGGQVQPRAGKWVNEDVFVFLQGDGLPADVTTVRYIGIGQQGIFCAEDQPPDFPHYHCFHAAAYREGHAGEPGESAGTWLLWMATQPFEAQDRQVSVGVDREFSPTPAPSCAEADQGSEAPAAGGSLTVEALEWRFTPARLNVGVGEEVMIEVTNAGTQLHTFTIASLGIDSGPIAPGEGRTVVLQASEAPGAHELICTFPDHAEAGMVGELVIG